MYEMRKHKILQLLEKKEHISVRELRDYLDVSAMTIQRDLTKMEQEGLIIKGFGEISRVKGIYLERLMLEQEIDIPENQHKIAAYAGKLVEDGDTVLFSSGNIIFDLAKRCTDRNFIAITPSIRAALALSKAPGTVYMTGGTLGKNGRNLQGEYAEMVLRCFYADKAFITCASVNSDGEMCEYTEEEVRIKRILLEHSKRTYLLIEAAKFGISKVFRSQNLTAISDIITDQPLPEEYRLLCDQHAINVHIINA